MCLTPPRLSPTRRSSTACFLRLMSSIGPERSASCSVRPFNVLATHKESIVRDGAVLVAWLSVAASTIAPQALVADAAVAAPPPNVPRYPWLDPALSAEERAHAAAEAVAFEEKLSWLQGDTTLDANGTGINSCVGHLPSIERLGLPALCFGDGPAGVGNGMTHGTAFPAGDAAASAAGVGRK